MSTISGLANFPFGLWFNKKALGKSYEIRIGGTDGKLLLPIILMGSTITNEILGNELLPPTGLVGQQYDNIKWGRVVMISDMMSQVDFATIHFQEIDSNDLVNTGNLIFDQYNDWINRLKQFI